jgi:hypothetical protein
LFFLMCGAAPWPFSLAKRFESSVLHLKSAAMDGRFWIAA